MKLDPYNHKEKYLNWKSKNAQGIPNLKPENSKIILSHIFDMEEGINIAKGSKKGARSFIRLNNIKQRLIFLTKLIETRNDKFLGDLTESEIIMSRMRKQCTLAHCGTSCF